MEKYQEQIIDLLNSSIHDTKPKLDYSKNVDWDKIIEESNAHSITGLLYPALKRSGNNIDNEIIDAYGYFNSQNEKYFLKKFTFLKSSLNSK